MWLHSGVKDRDDTASTDTAAPPYPLPEGWSVRAAKREPLWRIVIYALVYVVCTWRLFVHLAEGSIGWAVLMLFIAGLAGAVVVGEFWLAGGERGRPEFVNAVAFTRAEVRPSDSWVHLFRDNRVPVFVIVGLFVLATTELAGSVWATVLAWRSGDGEGWWLFATIPAVLLWIVAVVGAISALITDRRVSSFGRRATGLAIGPTAIVDLQLDDPVEIAWTVVRDVEPVTTIRVASSGDFVAGVNLHTHDGRTIPLALSDKAAHAWLVFTALKFWAEHPESRGELGTTFAQQRMLAWHAAMHGA